MRHLITTIIYRATWRIWRFVFRFFLHWEAEYKDEQAIKKLKEGRQPVLLVSNHVSWADPWIIGVAMPQLVPKNLAYYKIFWIPVVGQIAWLYGAIKLKKGIGLENSLKKPIRQLKKGRTVGIFPQGKRMRSQKRRKARRGVGYLVKHADPIVIPVFIKGGMNMRFFEVISRKRNIKVHIGKPFRANYSQNENYYDISEKIWDKVEELK